MIRLIIDNRYVTIVGADRRLLAALEMATSFRVAGAYYSAAYRMKKWDGREHLMSFNARYGYRTPVGLLEDVCGVLNDNKIKFKMNTKRKRKQTTVIEFNWNKKIKLRSYQKKAVKKITNECKRRGELKGVGILNLPIRSGKTKTAAAVINELGARTLFVVTSNTLLYQSKESLEDSLGVEVGMIGDGIWEEQTVTVAMAQTLSLSKGGKRDYVDRKTGKKKKKILPRDPRFTALIGKYDLVIFDECHHLTSDLWHSTMLDFDAPYRIGLSATVFFENSNEHEKGVIWLKACCGNVRSKVSTSYLIERGWLMRPLIKIYQVNKPGNLYERKWSQDLHSKAIFLNKYRNNKIARLAAKYVKKGLRVLIVSSRLEQVAALRTRLELLGIDHDAVTGATTVSDRNDKIRTFSQGECRVLIGTVFKEGVDIPEIEVVINAEGGKDVKMTIQKMRNLTPHHGKTEAVYIDFNDAMNPYFEKHSKARLEQYEAEPAFTLRRVKLK
jgi:superfamily II DNA or RNA helicase